MQRVFAIPPFFLAVAVATLAAPTGCREVTRADSASQLETERIAVRQESAATIERFRNRSSSIQRLFDASAGYAVFPRVTRGGAGIGGAHGAGVLYEQDTIVGYADLYQATLGAQLGGQTFSEIVFFQHEDLLRDFKRGEYELSAGLSAVALDQGEVGVASFRNGVAVVTMVENGFMLEMSVGGQRFRFTPEFRDVQ